LALEVSPYFNYLYPKSNLQVLILTPYYNQKKQAPTETAY